MTERNRVTPLGDVVAVPLRGAWTGNRGRIHSGHEIVRFHAGDLWITCTLAYRGRWNQQWQPHHYTYLFFHDEAVSFAAGHRPCAECRRADYEAFRLAWADAASGPVPSARELNARLHAERIVRGTHRRRLYEVAWRDLPDGAFVLDATGPALVDGDALVPWGPDGYGSRRLLRRRGAALVITPPSILGVLHSGYPVQIDASAR